MKKKPRPRETQKGCIFTALIVLLIILLMMVAAAGR